MLINKKFVLAKKEDKRSASAIQMCIRIKWNLLDQCKFYRVDREIVSGLSFLKTF